MYQLNDIHHATYYSNLYMLDKARQAASKFDLVSLRQLIRVEIIDVQNMLQRIIDEMVKCVNEAQNFERDIFMAHIVKYNIIYVGYVVAIYTTLTFLIFGPLVLPIPTLVEVEYPFQVNYTPVNFIVYLHHSSACLAVTTHLCIGVFGALLMWFAAVRFECLVVEIQKTTNIRMLVVCIKKQLHLRR